MFKESYYSRSMTRFCITKIVDADKLANYFDETIMEGVLLDNSTPHHVQIRVESDSDRD